MSDLVGNPEDRFSRVAAHIIETLWLSDIGFLSRESHQGLCSNYASSLSYEFQSNFLRKSIQTGQYVVFWCILCWSKYESILFHALLINFINVVFVVYKFHVSKQR